MADRTILLAQNGRHALRGLTQVNPQEFSAYQELDDSLTYVVDMSAYLDGDTITAVTRQATGVSVSNESNTTTRLTQRLKGFGFVDISVTTSSGDVEEFRITISSRSGQVQQQIAAVPEADIMKLTADRTYYVRTDGSDGSGGLVNTSAGAFRTIQAAVDAALALDFGGYTVTIQVADGTYTDGVNIRCMAPGMTASNPLQIIGNTSTPANCVISTTSASCFKVDAGAQVLVNGFELRTTTTGRCLHSVNNSYLVFSTSMRFGTVAQYHMEAAQGGKIVSVGGYSIVGGGGAHMHCTSNGFILIQSGTITITGTPAFSVYFAGVNGAYIQFSPTTTFSGSATGPRYIVHDNGTIYTGNNFIDTFLPGSSNGQITGGGIINDVSSTWMIVGASAVQSSVTGTTSETVLATVTIPGNLMGANGIIRIYSNWSNNNNANNKTARIRLNGLGTQAILGTTSTTSLTLADLRQVQNVNATNSQKCWQFSSTGGLGQSIGAVTTAAIDTTADMSLVFTGQLANAADNIAIENYTVEVCYRP